MPRVLFASCECDFPYASFLECNILLETYLKIIHDII